MGKIEKTEKIVVKLSGVEKQTVLEFANKNSVNISALVRKLLLDHIASQKSGN